MQRVQGFAEQGDQRVLTEGFRSTTVVQGSFPGATITVYYTGTTILAPIFSDNAATPTPLANPFTANIFGHWFFYAANGRYDVQISGGGLLVPWTIGDVLLADPGGTAPPVIQFPLVVSTNYCFQQTLGVALAVGLNTVTLAPVPTGVNGSDQGHWLYIEDITSEPVLIIGGTAIAGAPSGTIIVNCVNAHAAGSVITTATACIQEAVYSTVNPNTVFIPDGTYTLHGPITVRISSAITGSSKYGVNLNIASDFPLTVEGVFVGPIDGGNGPYLSGFSLAFIQPDSTNLALYTRWPAAFYLTNTARFTLDSIMVMRAWNGVVMTGNAGGAMITDLEMSHFNWGIAIDGALDSVYLNTVRFWPYGCTTNQQVARNTDATIGLNCERVDDLNIVNFFADCGTGMYFGTSANGIAGGQIVNVTLDSLARIVFNDGDINISNLIVSMISSNDAAITVLGGVLRISNFVIGAGNPGAGRPTIYQTGGVLTLRGGEIATESMDQPSIQADAGTIFITDSWFFRAPNVTYAQPTIIIDGSARATIIGNRTEDKGTGTGIFIFISTAGFHQVRGNSFVGWSSSYPANRQNGVYEDQGAMQYPIQLASGSYNLIPSTAVTGGANAIAGSLPVPLQAGLSVTIVLPFPLQAGPNTFNYNGTGPLPIRKHTNIGQDLTTPYAVGGIITLVTDLAFWLDMSQ